MEKARIHNKSRMISIQTGEKLSYKEYLSSFKKSLKTIFTERNNIEEFITERGFPALVLRDIMAHNPLSVAIPTEYGGRGCQVRECLGVLEAASYESLPLSLTFGINIALFLEPVAKYADDSVKQDIFDRFLTKQNMGGLMITEPDYGSDALNMQTRNVKVGNHYHIKGVKHWQGLTGMADYWLMTCRGVNENGDLARDVDFFICDEQAPGQQILVEEVFKNIGLYPIPYGRNRVDIKVPETYKLIPETTGLKLMMDLLHRSRYQFAGMGMGFIKRMMDEAISYCSARYVGGKPLIQLDSIKYQISKIQAAFTICSGMCHRSAAYSGIENNLATDIVEANSIKAYVTDLMHNSAQTLTQLSGAKGYQMKHVGGRGIMDSRPFQIFEGSNEMLYTQIGESVAKLMRRKKVRNLYEFLSSYELTQNSVDRFKSILSFAIEDKAAQRKSVDLGRIISRVVSANYVLTLGEKGFRPDLIRDCLKTLVHEVQQLVSSYKYHSDVVPIEDYQSDSFWLDLS